MRNLTRDDFQKTGWPSSSASIVQGILDTQASVFSACGIVHILQLAHLMGQISHECGAGLEIVESLNYSATALLSQWGKHFTMDTASRFGRTAQHPADQRMIANIAYGGRMGNRSGTDDGWMYRGRGLLQITGRDSYERIGKVCGIDLLQNPQYAVDPRFAFRIASTEFARSGCLPYADADNVLCVSALINVGHIVHDRSAVIGIDSREEWTARWKKQLAGLS